MRLAFIFLATGAVSFNLAAQIFIFDKGEESEFCVAAQGKDGEVFAGLAGKPWVWKWNYQWQPSYGSRAWQQWSSSQTGTRPVSFEESANGVIVSIWEHERDGRGLINVIHSHVSQAFPAFAGPAQTARAILAANTCLWITEAGVNILKAKPTQEYFYRQRSELIHTITVDELWPGGDATNRMPVSMVEDAQGRIWFWSNCQLGGDARGAVRGVLIAGGDKVAHHPGLAGVATNRISVIAPLDSTSLWLAVRDAGIFSVNLDTLAGERVAEPETNAFRLVQTIFSVGGDRYVIGGQAGQYNPRGLASVLWRWRGGRWTKLIDGLDACGSQEQLANRRWRATKDGLWLGAFGMGGWFFPNDDSAPRQINWRAGSPFDTVDRWFELKDGRMVALQFGRGGLVADAVLLTAPPAVPPTSQIVRISHPLVQTDEGKIFAVLRGDESALNEWTGKDWKRHPLPDNLQLWGDCRIVADARGRVWLIDWNYNPDPVLRPCLILDPARGRFQRFSNFPTALQAQAVTLAGTDLGRDDSFAAAFSRDGRVCYEDRTWNLRFFNGREWRPFHLNQIAGGLRDSANRDPFFADDGKLSIILNGTLWQFEELSGWRDTAIPASAVTKPAHAKTANLPGGPPNVPDAESIVADARSVFWVVARKQLFRVGYGLRVPCFPANEPQPFADGRKLTRVWLDNFGNAFLNTSLQGRAEVVLVPARAPLPDTTAKLVENGGDGATLQLAANISAPRFSWRVDDGAWSEAVTNQTVRLDDVSAGKHRVQFIAIDERLQADPTPAEVVVEVRSNPAERIGKWIAALGDKDFAKREAAVKALARKPDLSLPALRQALKESSNPDQRWWVQAAIQACEEQK